MSRFEEQAKAWLDADGGALPERVGRLDAVMWDAWRDAVERTGEAPVAVGAATATFLVDVLAWLHARDENAAWALRRTLAAVAAIDPADLDEAGDGAP